MPLAAVAVAAVVGVVAWAAQPHASHAGAITASGPIHVVAPDRLRATASGDAAPGAGSATPGDSTGSAQPGAKPPADVAESQTVPLLVASPEIKHPIFQSAVIFAAPLPSGGHLGIILNRPTDAKMGEIFPDHEPSQRLAEPVFFGGPVQSQIIVALIRSTERPSEQAMPIAKQMYIAFDAPTIDEAIERNPEQSRFYAGFVVWPPQALERQIAEGAWSVKQVEAGRMLNKETTLLWPELSGAKGPTDAPAGKRPIQRGERPSTVRDGRIIDIGGRIDGAGIVR
jgi:putative transcriptional regulator